MRTSSKPCLRRKRTISLPLGRCRSPIRGHSGEIPIELPDRNRRYQPTQGIFEPERFDVSLERLPEISDCLLLRLTFSVGGDVRDTGGKPTQLGVWNQLDG